MMRVKTLKELGKGHWKISSITPLKEKKKTGNISTSSSMSAPQQILWLSVSARWPDAISEYNPKIPGRKFRLDIAFLESKLCVEMDGWQYHGKYLSDFKRDREKQNLLVINGWRVLRFTASDVYQDLESCLNLIDAALSIRP